MTGELYCCAISKELGHPFHFPGCLLYWPRQVLRAALCKACELPYPRVIFSSSACLPFVKLGFIEWFYLHAAGSKGPWLERWWYKGDHSLAADAHQHPSVIHSDPYQISQQRDAWIDLQPVTNTIECVCVEEWLIRHYTDVSSASQVSEVDWVLEFRYSLYPFWQCQLWNLTLFLWLCTVLRPMSVWLMSFENCVYCLVGTVALRL